MGQTTKGGIVESFKEIARHSGTGTAYDKNQNDGDDCDDIDHVVVGHALGADFVWIFAISVPLRKLCLPNLPAT